MVLGSSLSSSKYKCDKGTRWLILHCLESSEVFLNDIMESAELLVSSISEGSGLKDHMNVYLVDEAWVIITCLYAFDGFKVAIIRSRQTFNDTPTLYHP